VPSPALTFTECTDKTWNSEPIPAQNGSYDVGADFKLTEFEQHAEEDLAYHGAYVQAVPPTPEP